MTYQELIETAGAAEAAAALNAHMAEVNLEVSGQCRALSLGFKRLSDHCRQAALDLPVGDAEASACCDAPDVEVDGLC